MGRELQWEGNSEQEGSLQQMVGIKIQLRRVREKSMELINVTATRRIRAARRAKMTTTVS